MAKKTKTIKTQDGTLLSSSQLAMKQDEPFRTRSGVVTTNARASGYANSLNKSASMRKHARAVISTGETESYSPLFQESSLMMPSKMREIFQYCRHWYRSDPMVSAAINFHSEFAIGGFKNKCEDKKVQKYFDELAFDIVKIPQLLSFISLEWFKLGNCFKADTKIITNYGLKNIQDIEDGDYVLTHKNRYRKVTSIMEREIDEEILEIRIDKLKYRLNCTQEHPILCLKDNKEEWVKAKEIRSGDMVKIGKYDYELNDINKVDIKQWWFDYELDDKEVVLEDNGNNYSYLKYGYFKGLKFDKTKNDKIKFLNWIINLDKEYIDMTYQEVRELLNIEKKDDFRNMLRHLGKKIPDLRYERIHIPEEKTRWYKLDYSFNNDDQIFYKQSKRKFISNINEIEINNDFMYLLGYWLGDGCLFNNDRYKNEYGLRHSRWEICIGKMYPEFISNIKRIMNNLSLSYEISSGLHDKKESSTISIYIRDPLFCEWWNNEFGSDCRKKKIPEWIFELPDEKIKNLICGLIDSDGYVVTNYIEIGMINEQLIQNVFELLKKIGYYPSLNNKIRKGFDPQNKYNICQMFTVQVFNCYDLLDSSMKKNRYIKLLDNNFKGCRKFEINDDNLYYRVNSIKKYKDKTTVYNFSVEEDESYVANNIVVHNCYPMGIWDEGEGRWERFITLNPDYVEIEKSLFSDSPILKLDPDESLKRIVQNKSPRALYDQLDPAIISYIAKGQKVPLSDLIIQTEGGDIEFPQVCQIARKASQYEVYGTPMMAAAFKVLIYKDLLRNAQYSIARRHWKPIKLVKVGDATHEPTPEILDSVEEAIKFADADPNGWIVWNSYITAEYIASAGKTMPLECHDEQTQVLTENGWKYWYEYQEEEKIASLNLDTKNIEFIIPNDFVVKDYNGKMIKWEGQYLNYCVTPGHGMLVQTPKYNKYKKQIGWKEWKKINANKVPSYSRTLGRIDGVKRKINNIEMIDVIGNQIPIKLFLQFAGWYITEGCSSIIPRAYKVSFSQSKNSLYINSIFEMVKQLPLNIKIRDRGSFYEFIMCSKELCYYMNENFGCKSYNKKFPRWFFDLPDELLKEFLLTLIYGDGAINPASQDNNNLKYYTYTTVSPELMDLVQELAFRLKYVVHSTFNSSKGTNYPIHLVHFSDSNVKGQYPILNNFRYKSEIDYDGKIWCFNVNPHHIFVTRRKGIIGISYNSEYKFVDLELMRALEISDAVLTNQGMTFANASVSLRVMVNKYMRFQKLLSDWIKNFIYKPIAQVQGFYKTNDEGKKELIIPDIEWELIRLQDDAQMKTMLQAMQQKGLISKNTLMSYMGLDYDKEKKLIEREKEDVAIFTPSVPAKPGMPSGEGTKVPSGTETVPGGAGAPPSGGVGTLPKPGAPGVTGPPQGELGGNLPPIPPA